MLRSAYALLLLSLATLTPARTASDSASIDWISSFGSGCSGSSYQLSNFEFGSLRNNTGGHWYTYADTSASGTSAGSSVLEVDSSTSLQGIAITDFGAGITATLDKGDATTHPAGGWAGIATNLGNGTGTDTIYTLPGLKAFSFSLTLDPRFDLANIAGIVFKIGNGQTIVGDSAAFHAGISTSLLGVGKTVRACIDLSQLKQPAWHKAPSDSAPLRIGKLAWELQLKDGTTKSEPSAFFLDKVALWGNGETFDPDIIVCAPFRSSAAARATCLDPKLGISRNSAIPQLSARYAHGLVLSYALDGVPSAKIEVLRLDGSKVATVIHRAQVSNLSLPLDLARGTYLAVVQGGKQKLVAPFTVTQ